VKVRLRVPAVDDPDFVVDLAHGEVAVLRLVGSADTAAIEPLGELLVAVHQELLERKTREIVVDMRGLDRMIAACFRQLLAWLGRVQPLEADARYRIRFRLNPSIAWQQHGMPALSCFDTDLIAIET
jgi:hypothetical protein